MNMAAAPATPPQKQKRAPVPRRQIDFLRDGMLIVYVVYQLSGGLQRMLIPALSGSASNQAMTILMLGVGILCCLFDRVRLARIVRGIWPFVLPAILILASITWSDYPDVGARRATRFILELAGFIMLLSAFRDSRTFLRSLWIAFAILLVLDVAALAMPSMSFTSLGYAGIHNHKNSMGSFGYLAVPLFFIGWRERYLGRYSGLSLAFAAICFGLLVASLSKTSIFLMPFCGLLAFIGYTVWKRGFATQLTLGLLFLLTVVMLTAPLTDGGLNVAEMVGAVTGDATMTGRTGVWDYTFWRVGERQLTGVGYGSFWEVDPFAGETMRDFGIYWTVNQSHNGYIGVFAELGWLGVAAVLSMWLFALIAVLRRIGNPREEAFVGYALYTALGYLLYNVTETSFFRAGYDSWIHYLMMMLAVAKLAAPVQTVRRAAAARMRRPVSARPAAPVQPRLSGPTP